MSAPPRGTDRPRRFRAAYDPLSLVEVVIPAVARAAAGKEGDLRRVSTRDYDKARVRGGFPESPSAQACAGRVSMRWPDLLAHVFNDERDNFTTLGAATRRDQRSQMPPELAADALRSVARLNGVTEVTPANYDVMRKELVTRDKRTWLHTGALDVTLPTSDQIRQSCRIPEDPEGWTSALSLAGFAAPKIPRGSIPVDIALERFLQDAGWLRRSRDTLVRDARTRVSRWRTTARTPNWNGICKSCAAGVMLRDCGPLSRSLALGGGRGLRCRSWIALIVPPT